MTNLPPILPVGTAVVVLAELRRTDGHPGHPAGSTGLIVHSPSDPAHAYRVRLPGGEEFTLHRDQVQPLRHFQRGPIGGADSPDGPDLRRFIILRCIVGSRAYGLDGDASDTDRRGIYLPPADLHWSLYGVPEQIQDDAAQECYWELQKFLQLALKANPNVLEAMYTPLVEFASPVAAELLAMRSVFLSRLVYQTFNGYAMSQFRKLEQDLRRNGQIKWKHAMHLLRLLLSGAAALRTGDLPVRVEREREQLLEVRDGRMPWERVEAWRLRLHKEFEDAFAATCLPERPDYDRANALLIRARREMTASG